MIFSLQRRFVAFLLLPVSLILAAIGVASFLYAREHLLDEWTDAAQLRLEKAAHEIQMLLDEKRELLDLIAEAGRVDDGGITQTFLLQRLSREKGVGLVDIRSERPRTDGSGAESGSRETSSLEARVDRPAEGRSTRNEHAARHGSTDRRTADQRNEAPVSLNVSTEGSRPILSLERPFWGPAAEPVGIVEVRVYLDTFMKHILQVGRWKGSYACLVKADGTYLAHTDKSMRGAVKFGERGNTLENRVLSEMKTKDFGTLFGKGHPPDLVAGFYKVPTTDWYLLLFSEGDVVMAPLVHFRLTYMIAGAASLICVGLLIAWNTRPVAKSVREISEAAEKVEYGEYDVTVPEDRSDEIGYLKRRFNRMIRGLKERDLIERTFGRYVGKEIAQELMKQPEALRLGGEKHVVTILMGDLRGFTYAAEKLRSDDVTKLLNRHFARMIGVIEAHKGIIVDFVGDAILAFFDGMDTDVTKRASDAVKCALEMQQELAVVSKRNYEEGLPVLEMGIGIHTGEVVVGNIGSESRAKYGIVGSAVNETDRIQSVAEGGTVVISEQTYKLLEGRIEVGPKLEVNLKGLDASRRLYQVKAIDDKAGSTRD
jgi:class 3 adenylate cyclase